MKLYFLFLFFIIVLMPVSFSYNWSVETVSTGNVGSSGSPYLTRVVLDSVDNPHIIYRDGASGTPLIHSYRSGESWATDSIGSGNNPYYIGAVSDSSGNIYVSFEDSDSADQDLRFYSYNGSWSGVTKIDDTGSMTGYNTSIAYASNGHLGISYMLRYLSTAVQYDLYYTEFDGTSWSREAVQTTNNVGTATFLAFDSSNHAHIAYCDDSADDTMYATNASGSWVTTQIDTGSVCNGTSIGIGIAIDSLDHIHLCYYDSGSADMEYAYYDGVSWALSTINSAGNVGKGCSIAVNSYNEPNVSYYDETNKKLKMGHRVDGVWTLYSVDTEQYSGMRGTSIAVDSQNGVHIGYNIGGAPSGNKIKYAYTAGIPPVGPPVEDNNYWNLFYNGPNSGYYSGNVSVDFNIEVNPDTSGVNLEIYLSSSQGGFETKIVDLNVLDYSNISELNCSDSNFMNSINCTYDLNLLGVVDGNYYVDLNLFGNDINTQSSSATIYVDNTPPTISSVSINSESQLVGGDYALTATILDAGSDLNGDEIYRCWSTSSSEEACIEESWDCKLGAIENVTGDSYSATVSGSLKDTAGTWTCKIYATDNVNNSNTGTDTETMAVTTGISIDSSSGAYSGDPDSNANPILTDQGNAYITVTHTGNSNIDVYVTGDNFVSVDGNIDVSAQKFKGEDDYGNATVISGLEQSIISSWSRGTYSTNSNSNVWFWLDIPLSSYHGDYISNLTFNSVESG